MNQLCYNFQRGSLNCEFVYWRYQRAQWEYETICLSCLLSEGRSWFNVEGLFDLKLFKAGVQNGETSLRTQIYFIKISITQIQKGNMKANIHLCDIFF